MTNSTDHHGGTGKGKRGSKRGGDVIHVEFGRPPASRGRTEPPRGPQHPGEASTSAGAAPPGAPCEPVTDVFSTREVAKLLDVPTARLRSLDRAGIVTPSGSRGGKRAYTFQDLIAL